MKRQFLIILSFFLASCAGNAHLQRVVHEESDYLVVLDKGDVPVSPSFEGPFQHPVTITPESLQGILESIQVVPSSGILNALISGKDETQPLFDSISIQRISSKLSQALSKADPSERAGFYHALPRNAAGVYLTSGFLLVKDKQLHVYVKHFKVPHRKRQPFSTVGNGIPPSEMTKYRFVLLENKQMAHRTFKNIFGFEGSNPRWLVVDYLGFTPVSKKSHPLSDLTERLEEKLRTLKRLKEEGLISDDEYTEKKRSLLMEF